MHTLLLLASVISSSQTVGNFFPGALALGEPLPAFDKSEGAESVLLLPAKLGPGVKPHPGLEIFTESLLTYIHRKTGLRTASWSDLAAALDLEKKKDILGCDAVACLADIVGALNVDKVLAVQVVRVEERWAISSKMLSVRGELVVEARDARFVDADISRLVDSVPRIGAALLEASGVTTRVVLDVEDPQTYSALQGYISSGTYRRYVNHMKRAGPQMPVAVWVHEQNKESTALAIAELIGCLGGLLLVGEGESGAKLGGLSMGMGCVALPIVDMFDFGSVRERSAPPQIATVMPL